MKDVLIAADICLFAKGPQEISHSKWPLGVFLLLLIPMYAEVLFQLQQVTFLTAVIQSASSIAIMFFLLAVGLWFSNKSQRFQQTASALMGAAVVLGLFMLIYMYLMRSTYGFDGFDAQYETFPLKMLGGFMPWSFAILAHILRHSFSKSPLFSLGLSFLLVFSLWRVMGLLLPLLG